MSSITPAPTSRVNIPRMVLWLASIVLAVGGYLLIHMSNSNEAAIYTSGKADYAKLFAAQSGSTIGGLLIAVAALGALLALASMAITRRPAATPEVVVLNAVPVDAVPVVAVPADDRFDDDSDGAAADDVDGSVLDDAAVDGDDVSATSKPLA